MSAAVPKVFIIVLNWNNIDDTLECLDSAINITYPNYEIVFIDNHSNDNPVQTITRKYPGIHIIENEENIGYAGGNNRGIEYSMKNNAEYVFLLNNDTTVDKECLNELVKVFGNDSHICAAGPMTYDYYQPGIAYVSGETINWWRGKPSYKRENKFEANDIINMSFLSGCAILVRSDVIKKVGMMDENYFLFYEDIDWCCRMRKAGFKVVSVPAAKIWHKESRTTGGTYTPAGLYYGTRNRLYFMKKNATLPVFIFFLIFVFPFSVIKNIWRWRSKKTERNCFLNGILDFFKGRYGKGTYNI
ncbi:MAG: glycosyltransferase family 2 protein [Elusimicrobiota bacterium]